MTASEAGGGRITPLGLIQSPESGAMQQSGAEVTHRRAVDAVFMIWSSVTIPLLTTLLPLKNNPSVTDTGKAYK